jgi:hypothetical protein
MTAVVTIESIILGIVVLVVIGLLRAYGEILRTQSDGHATSSALEAPEVPFQVREGLPGPKGVAGSPAHDIVGVNIDGGGVKVTVPRSGGLTLLAFLSSGCLTCADFWRTFGDGASLPAGARGVIVTRDLAEESPSKLRDLARGATLVVASSAAWQDYGVPGSPFFVLADGDTGRIRGQGTGATWTQVESLVGQYLDDYDLVQAGDANRRVRRRMAHAKQRSARVDAELAAAGIVPGDPRLYHDRRPPQAH